MSETENSNQTSQRFSQTVDRVKSELDRLVEVAWTRGGEALQQFRNYDPESDWVPDVDLIETEQSLILLVNLPGVPADQVEISLVGNSLEITSEYESLTLQSSDKVHQRERPTGRIHRVIALPLAVENDSAVAQSENGVFRIELKKSSNLQVRKVPVTVIDDCQPGEVDEKGSHHTPSEPDAT